MKKVLIVLVLLALAGGGASYWYYNNSDRGYDFRTAQVERGTLIASISATGTLVPEEVVDIGAQIAGQIRSFGRDPRDSSKPIDFGTPVEDGTVLAQIDDAIYKAQVDEARADLDFGLANVKRVEAELKQMEAKLVQTQRDWERAQKLGPKNVISGLDYDMAQNAFETAKAAIPAGDAGVLQAKKGVERARAILKRAETNLGYTVFKSPVKGVIIARRVNIGQTVVASLNAPSLFLIAKDLRKMQVWGAINEADISKIRAGQAVRFTVDAHPNEVFQGEVGQIRLDATMTQNVVTYTVVVNTDNAHGRFMPYQTANLQFLVSQHDNVLQVPNAALRWRPAISQVSADARAAYAKSLRRKNGQGVLAASADKDLRDRGTLWLEDNGRVRPLMVRLGASDGIMTQVTSEEVAEGMDVVVGENRQENGDNVTNPFTPSFGQRRQQSAP